MTTRLPEERIVAFLQAALQQPPELLGVWLFGSQANGHANAGSDVDLAVLVAGKVDTVRLWEVGQALATELDLDVDLLDLRAASTVTQYQVITTGRRLWQKDAQAALYESAILSDKTELDAARRELLMEVREQGRVYGKP
ncbi:nucleotidyltransferase-like protein [Pseudoduganella lurida]|uniref:Nucleotidyltransferase-like protein n=1 Tax=Pseudoduganella lurida TaxID=1036180 RepID=A0A562RAM7_9BURK|nr:nucleotidyltransferase domain-containing protein [Pseudoduganella lurida]TWI66105.1 nucleotidyltransferase-like protein [Pseudoduganella lurida]